MSRRCWFFAIVLLLYLFASQGGNPAWCTEKKEFAVPRPPLSEDYYPCAENCHNDMETNFNVRELKEEHTNINLHHAEQIRWCLDCHDADNRDQLHLQSGEKLDFEHSYRLCGQCHGVKYRDWKSGIHGKRTGFWNGKKQYLLCVHCHNPHRPKFAPLKPEPAPIVPRYGVIESPGTKAKDH